MDSILYYQPKYRLLSYSLVFFLIADYKLLRGKELVSFILPCIFGI